MRLTPESVNQVIAEPSETVHTCHGQPWSSDVKLAKAEGCDKEAKEAKVELKANIEAAMTIGKEMPDCLERWKARVDRYMLKKKDADEQLRKEEL